MSKYVAGYMDQGMGHGHWRLCHADTMLPVESLPVEDALKMAAADELYAALKDIRMSNAGSEERDRGWKNALSALEKAECGQEEEDVEG